MTEVAIRKKHWDSLDVFHELDDDGEVKCHFGGHDKFRVVEKDDLPEDVDVCANCDGRGYARGNHKQNCWAAKLRAADDPEEVLTGDA